MLEILYKNTVMETQLQEQEATVQTLIHTCGVGLN